MRSLHTATKSRPHSPQPEEAHAQQRRPNAAKKINKFFKKINQTQIKAIMEEIRDKKTIRHTENNKMAKVSSSLIVITLNENGLRSPITKHKLTE